MSARPASIVASDALLAEILAELKGLRADLRQVLEARRPVPERDRAAELVRAIAGTAGDRVFTAGEVIAHSTLPAAAPLRDALTAAMGAPNARALGKLFRRIEGMDLGGLAIQRRGSDRDGVIWRVVSLR